MDGWLIRLSEGSVFFRRKDEERWGEYRTKRLALGAFELLTSLIVMKPLKVHLKSDENKESDGPASH
jgi:hypothetical protein